jgi:hypothetical protein
MKYCVTGYAELETIAEESEAHRVRIRMVYSVILCVPCGYEDVR